MAATLPDEEKEDRNLDQCPQCHGKYEDARMLPCLHTFCLRCIETAIWKRPAGTGPTCPTCSGSFEAPAGGLELLFHNAFIQNVGHFSEVECGLLDTDILCHNHSTDGGKTKGSCLDCEVISCARYRCQ